VAEQEEDPHPPTINVVQLAQEEEQ